MPRALTAEPSASGGGSAAACDAANEQARSERPELARRRLLTRAIMCDASPPCVTEMTFSHEFWWAAPEERHRRRRGKVDTRIAPRSRCRAWTDDADWPTKEPHLSRATLTPRARSFWDVLQLLPNRTVWLHGDSIQLQMCDAAICSLMRAGVAPAPVLAPPNRHPPLLRNLSAASGYNFLTTLLPNGARLLCSGIGPYQLDAVERVLPHVDVAVLNFGLHYHTTELFRSMLSTALLSLNRWQRAAPRQRVALWREGSAQHFRLGSYAPGDEKQAPAGQPCQCHALHSASMGADDRQRVNLNEQAWKLEAQMAPIAEVAALRRAEPPRTRRPQIPVGMPPCAVHRAELAGRRARAAQVGLVPFFNLTAPRHDMHRGHYCAYSGQTVPGRCCDCTHFCYTPLFWDVIFGGLYRAVRRSAFGKRLPPAAAEDGGKGLARRVAKARARMAAVTEPTKPHGGRRRAAKAAGLAHAPAT